MVTSPAILVVDISKSEQANNVTETTTVLKLNESSEQLQDSISGVFDSFLVLGAIGVGALFYKTRLRARK